MYRTYIYTLIPSYRNQQNEFINYSQSANPQESCYSLGNQIYSEIPMFFFQKQEEKDIRKEKKILRDK